MTKPARSGHVKHLPNKFRFPHFFKSRRLFLLLAVNAPFLDVITGESVFSIKFDQRFGSV